jgi:hypothetical protein
MVPDRALRTLSYGCGSMGLQPDTHLARRRRTQLPLTVALRLIDALECRSYRYHQKP